MSAKKLLLASISVVCLQASVQGDEWGLVRCLKECTNVSCADATKQETCKTNCASNLGSIDACMKAKPQGSAQTTRPTPPPRRGLPQQPQPQPLPVEPGIKGAEEQTQPEKQGSTKPPMQRRQAMAFSRPPLEKTPSRVGPSELKKQPSTKGPQRPTQPLPTTSSHLGKKPSTVGVKESQSGPVGFVTKERCDLCGSALCGTDKKLLGDCKFCGDISSEKFEACRKLAEQAGFLDIRKQGISASMAQGQEDSVSVAKEKVEKFIILGKGLKPLMRAISTCEARDDNYEQFTEIFDGLKDEQRALESGGKPISNEQLSGWKTGLFGLRALACQQIINESNEKKKRLVSQKKKFDTQALDLGLERLDKLCKQGNALAQQDIKTGLEPTLKNFKEMLGTVSVIKNFLNSIEKTK